jgi:proline iminopeptidase
VFPEIEAYRHGWLQVSGLHRIYFEEVGHPEGLPVLFLHGGPGGGSNSYSRRFFDPKIFRAVLFDQRGAGRSLPFACIEENRTKDLVEDIEKLREHLGIQRWLVMGGSWGSTLALAYSIAHPSRVLALILRGIFLGRQTELDWLYGPSGAAQIFPGSYEAFLSALDRNERKHPLQSYYKRLTEGDAETQRQAVKGWNTWESGISQLIPDIAASTAFSEVAKGLAIARIECHYFVNGCFLEGRGLLEECGRIQHIPAAIVNGRYDIVCPPRTAYELHRALPRSELQIVQDAGHSTTEPGIARALVRSLNRFKSLF